MQFGWKVRGGLFGNGEFMMIGAVTGEVTVGVVDASFVLSVMMIMMMMNEREGMIEES